MSAPVWIVPTGIANLEAVAAAFRRLGRTVRLVDRADLIERATYLVLPGVGSFDGGIAALETRGWGPALAARVDRGAPTLAICLGFQLLCEASEEAPDRPGLARIPGRLERFGGGVRIPQLGWNRVHAPPGAAFLRTGVAYFANSYRLGTLPAGWLTATSRYGGAFAAAVERAGVLACQFHPELSGAFGQRVLTRWLALAPSLAEGPKTGVATGHAAPREALAGPRPRARRPTGEPC